MRENEYTVRTGYDKHYSIYFLLNAKKEMMIGSITEVFQQISGTHFFKFIES